MLNRHAIQQHCLHNVLASRVGRDKARFVENMDKLISTRYTYNSYNSIFTYFPRAFSWVRSTRRLSLSNKICKSPSNASSTPSKKQNHLSQRRLCPNSAKKRMYEPPNQHSYVFLSDFLRKQLVLSGSTSLYKAQ